jgi:hypothetical protein
MASRRATAKGEAALTPRQREWLRHLRACTSRGESMRGYAQRHRLSEHGLYQAAKDLRQRGVLAPARPRRAAAKRPTFVQVTPTPSSSIGAISTSTWRVRLPNGVVLEGSDRLGAEWLEALARL